jgi:hypothetical protein
MKTYKQLKFVGDKDSINYNINQLQELALSGNLDIISSSTNKRDGVFKRKEFVYEGLLYIPKAIALNLPDIIFEEFKDVNWGAFSFYSNGDHYKSLEEQKEQIEAILGSKGLESKVGIDYDLETCHSSGDSYKARTKLKGNVQGGVEEIFFAHEYLDKMRTIGIYPTQISLVFKQE